MALWSPVLGKGTEGCPAFGLELILFHSFALELVGQNQERLKCMSCQLDMLVERILACQNCLGLGIYTDRSRHKT